MAKIRQTEKSVEDNVENTLQVKCIRHQNGSATLEDSLAVPQSVKYKVTRL